MENKGVRQPINLNLWDTAGQVFGNWQPYLFYLFAKISNHNVFIQDEFYQFERRMSYPGKVFFANMAHDVFLCLPGPLVELSIPVHRPSRDNFPSPPPPPLYPLSPFPSSAEYAVYAVYAECAEYAVYAEYVEYAKYADLLLKQSKSGSMVPLAMFYNTFSSL